MHSCGFTHTIRHRTDFIVLLTIFIYMDSDTHDQIVKKIREMLSRNQYNSETVLMLGQPDKESLLSNLYNFHGFKVTWEEWEKCVFTANELEKLRIDLKRESDRRTVSEPGIRLDLSSVKIHPYWEQYSEHIYKELGSESATHILTSCENILKRLSLDSEEPIRGLVHGSVQSGKTANMEGLISMAADYGFNVFIVFTGNVTSLNDQTKKRFEEDLQRGQYTFQMISTDEKKVRFEPAHKSICVTMKTNSRIKKIIRGLTNNPSLAQKYKILVIDDEADYASINSASDGKPFTGTNRFFRYLVNGKNVKGEDFGGRYGSMNYLAYTATPYANLLNEDDKESLYPSSFITSIVTSPRYFGPQQIFGVHTLNTDYPGLPIYCHSASLDDEFRRFENGHDKDLPEDLKEALAWFISAIAALRYRGFKKPLTMMINTSPNIDPHQFVMQAVVNYFESERMDDGELFDYCKIVYEREIKQFNKKILKENYPNYWGMEYPSHEPNIIEYPTFEEIIPGIRSLLGHSCQTIELDEDKEYSFSENIQICIENGAINQIQKGEEYNTVCKVQYPSKDMECPTAPAFIVIGGNILSRGLTLEGLISTFFVRPVKQADTLMQMGRWFGYRPKYELFPRIWMSDVTVRDYEFLARLDELLKDEICECNNNGLDPSQCAIRLLAIPDAQQLRGVLRSHTSKNKEKKIKKASVNYSGRYEEFCTFKNSSNQLKGNLACVRNFLNSLPALGITPEHSDKPEDKGWGVFRWRDVPAKVIFDCFVNKFEYGLGQNDGLSHKYDLFKKWLAGTIEKGVLSKWTVIVAGTVNAEPDKVFSINSEVSVGKVNRAKRILADETIIDIKTLRNRADIFKDIFPSEFENKFILNKIKQGDYSTETRKQQREMENIENPLLLIYCIDKDSTPRKKEGARDIYTTDLNAVEDVAAFLVEVPSSDDEDDNMVEIDLDYLHLEKAGDEDN